MTTPLIIPPCSASREKCGSRSTAAPTSSAADQGPAYQRLRRLPVPYGLGHYFALQLTLTGPIDPDSQYLINIKKIDAVVRDRAVSTVEAAVRSGNRSGPARLAAYLFERLRWGWGEGIVLDSVRLSLSPFLSVSCLASELPMVRLSQKFEFSATHRLHNPALSDEQNQAIFGKCNNPHGHGHNYEVQVTLAGTPDETGVLIDVPRFEEIVGRTVIDRFDHRNLNVELPEFRELIPSVENIAMTIYRLLKPEFRRRAGEAGGGDGVGDAQDVVRVFGVAAGGGSGPWNQPSLFTPPHGGTANQPHPLRVE